jgi:hypothetical protein
MMVIIQTSNTPGRKTNLNVEFGTGMRISKAHSAAHENDLLDLGSVFREYRQKQGDIG